MNLAVPNVAIIAACMPLIASQLQWTHEKLRSMNSSGHSSSGQGFIAKSWIIKVQKWRARRASPLPGFRTGSGFDRLYDDGGKASAPAAPASKATGPVNYSNHDHISVRRDIDIELGTIGGDREHSSATDQPHGFKIYPTS